MGYATAAHNRHKVMKFLGDAVSCVCKALLFPNNTLNFATICEQFTKQVYIVAMCIILS